MKDGTRPFFYLALSVILTALTAVGCNSNIEDPQESQNQVTVASVVPLQACVDYDGVMMDVDGDGTEEPVYFGVAQDVKLQSRIRGNTGINKFSDVIFSSVTISYALSSGVNPPERIEAVTITVPADGFATQGIETVLGRDVVPPGFFGPGVTGTIYLRFRGEDAQGLPASATGQIPLATASVCDTI